MAMLTAEGRASSCCWATFCGRESKLHIDHGGDDW
jgi:hypothetical protein